ncbi:MAG: hypothetical protein Q8R07_03405 [Candidatus Uhrbacteria bacterium]|nr:hypothetical protein [Candidatus Uhrbacteria bacterium]
MTLDEYHEEEKTHPELWCNPIKPHTEMVIREWIVKYCGTFSDETKK